LSEQQSPNVEVKHVALVLERLPQFPSVETSWAAADTAIASQTVVMKVHLIVCFIVCGKIRPELDSRYRVTF
jgi:hypothetical protein